MRVPATEGRTAVKKTVRKVLIVILLLVFLGSLGMLLRQQQTYREGEDIYAQAEQLVQQPPAAEEEELRLPVESEDGTAAEPEPESDPQPEVPLESLSIESLQAVNSDVLGWIRIPDTALSYPLVRGADNDWYLNHAWNGQWTSVGSIFMDYRCAADLTDFHTIVYGHRMRNGSMFASLKYYDDQRHWEAHPHVFIRSGEHVRQYAIFAAYEAPVQSPTYTLPGEDESARQALIDFALDQSVIDTGLVPTTTDRILTLSTCTGDGYETRWVVQAVELQADPQT